MSHTYARKLGDKGKMLTDLSDLGPADDCLDFCITERTSCKQTCFNDLCYSECNVSFEQCVDTCPCRKSCPSGCLGCSSDFCKCSDPENDPDYVECEERILKSII